QDTEFLVTAIDGAAPSFPSSDWQQELGDLIEVFAQQWADHPWRPAVHAAMRSTSATRRRASENTAAIAASVARLLAALTPHLDQEQRYEVAVVLVETCQTLLNLSVQDGSLNTVVVEETKRLARAYLRAVALSQ
ncbi:MAG TPA: TetR/AcrR family transcriptional regulator, partial [Actinomycetota bacterium]|nr:TetR/AcrR family transcriptional regulator [Actinomycetota bacterium]